MSGVQQAVFQNQRSFGAPPGQQAYTTAGTYSWTAPAGVTSVSVVCVGSSPSTSYGSALAYKNNITVVPGNSYTVVVSSVAYTTRCSFNGDGEVSAGTLTARTGDGGGNGGSAGGGAGGYSGAGGSGGASGAGGGGGGGGVTVNGRQAGGGGVGILGQGSNGSGGGFGNNQGGTGGSGGSDGFPTQIGNPGAGGDYGGGGGADNTEFGVGPYIGGSIGAVRIIWPGNTRSFPSTNTGDL